MKWIINLVVLLPLHVIADRYIPTQEEVDAYRSSVNSFQVDRYNLRSASQSFHAPTNYDRLNYLRSTAHNLESLGLSESDEDVVLATLLRYNTAEEKRSEQMMARVCQKLQGIDDVRTIDPHSVMGVFENQQEKLIQVADNLWSRLIGKLTDDGQEVVTSSTNQATNSRTDFVAALQAAGSPVVPLFALQERCNRIGESITGVAK